VPDPHDDVVPRARGSGDAPPPISPEQREDVIVHMAAGLLGAYKYFQAQGEVSATAHGSEPRRNVPKVRRNDPCPGGSGKNYKRCCGG
jgi:uncharacterized protein YecA (UPF0149 family)